MSRSPYRWPADGSGAIIQQHSIAKHEVLRAYLVAYIQTLVASPAQEQLRLTLVDGFAGGGIYVHQTTRATVFGSPFVFLEATKHAEDLINLQRRKPINLLLDFFFIEVDPNACSSLRKTLSEQGYGDRIGKDIHVMNSTFESEVDSVLRFISNKGRKKRSIFLLDQYGYADVPTSRIQSIFAACPSAEIILTFNVDSFINYANDSDQTKKVLTDIGIPDPLRGRTFDEIKRVEADFRLYIQSCLYKGLTDACNARFYTPFFIRTEGHGDYWLVHLSQHHRARDVMARVHWANNNHFIHYGGAGLDMFHVLGYQAVRDSQFTGQSTLGFCFDNPAEEASVSALIQQLPPLIRAHHDGITFGDLFARTCNSSPADSSKFRQALQHLVQCKEITVTSCDGARRLSANTISDSDLLRVAAQGIFIF